MSAATHSHVLYNDAIYPCVPYGDDTYCIPVSLTVLKNSIISVTHNDHAWDKFCLTLSKHSYFDAHKVSA